MSTKTTERELNLNNIPKFCCFLSIFAEVKAWTGKKQADETKLSEILTNIRQYKKK